METTERVARLIASHAQDPHNTSRTVSAARKRLPARDRPHTGAAVIYAAEQGWFTVDGNTIVLGDAAPPWGPRVYAWQR